MLFLLIFTYVLSRLVSQIRFPEKYETVIVSKRIDRIMHTKEQVKNTDFLVTHDP